MKKYHLKKISVFFLLLTLFSCVDTVKYLLDTNYTNISLEGYITDKNTKEAISGARVVVLCWVYDTDTWDSHEVVKEVFTNKEGFYSITFEKGELLEITVTTKRYLTQKKSIRLWKSNNKLDFFL